MCVAVRAQGVVQKLHKLDVIRTHLGSVGERSAPFQDGLAVVQPRVRQDELVHVRRPHARPGVSGEHDLHVQHASSEVFSFVCWLLNVPATCECTSGTDLLRQLYVLPH